MLTLPFHVEPMSIIDHPCVYSETLVIIIRGPKYIEFDGKILNEIEFIVY